MVGTLVNDGTVQDRLIGAHVTAESGRVTGSPDVQVGIPVEPQSGPYADIEVPHRQ